MRTVEHKGQDWRVKWIPKGKLSGGEQGLESEITISCSPTKGAVQYLTSTTDEIPNADAFMSLDDERLRNLIRRSH